MNLGVFVSDYTITTDTLDRIKTDKLGLILVANGVYHATIKGSSLLGRTSNLYVLSEDLETRGIPDSDVDGKVKKVTYSDLVDLIFNEFEKIVWL